MAMQKKVDNWKLKKWFTVYAPKVFNDALVGEMPANDEKAAMGRNIVVSLDTLTHNSSHAYTNVVLKVTEVQGNIAHTKLIRISQHHSYIRSLVRRYRSIALSVLPVSTKDNIKVVVKLLDITKARTAHSKIVGIRKEMNEYTTNFFKENDLNTTVSSILEGRFQADLLNKLSHITDLNKIEVRKLEID